MKTIGLIGLSGPGGGSIDLYHRVLAAGRGGSETDPARVKTAVLDGARFRALQARSGWSGAAAEIIHSAQRLARDGAGILALTETALHKTAAGLEAAGLPPLIHAADAAAGWAGRQSLSGVGLLGSRFTCYDGFFRDRFRDSCRTRLILPEPADVELVNDLCLAAARGLEPDGADLAEVARIVEVQARLGAQAALITDSALGALVNKAGGHLPLPTVDLIDIHAGAIAAAARG